MWPGQAGLGWVYLNYLCIQTDISPVTNESHLYRCYITFLCRKHPALKSSEDNLSAGCNYWLTPGVTLITSH